MIRLQIKSPPQGGDIKAAAAAVLRIKSSDISYFRIIKKSVDARKKNDIKYVLTVDVACDGEEKLLKKESPAYSRAPEKYCYSVEKCGHGTRPVVVGFGPAGMFASLVLALSGMKPLVIERGSDADTRQEKVRHFLETGQLDTECNVQFGEGGAGTFSDGKLNTGKNNERIQWVLEQFHECGAPENILYDAKPHIGTDILVEVVKNIRKKIISLGGEIRFDTKLTDIKTCGGAVTAVTVQNRDQTYNIDCDILVLATGHSARDTFEMLLEKGLPMQRKAFSMGARIEHRQKMINDAQYGKENENLNLPAADYKLVCHLEDRSVYTFCMCPGGEVIASASEEGGVVTNGMSNSSRNGENANAAVLVSVQPEDFPGEGVLAGMYWQRDIEKRAYDAGGKNYYAVSQKVGDFLKGRKTECAGKIRPTYRPGVTFGSMEDVLPETITESLKKALPYFDRKIRGFASDDALLTAPETRSSSPVRVLRNENMMSDIKGIYPSGEGAGYAGGITSSCVDGMLCAENIISFLNKNGKQKNSFI